MSIDADERARRLTQPPSSEQTRLANLLTARFPQLRIDHESANHVELSDDDLWTRISIFENVAGIGMHPGRFTAAKYVHALQLAWACLELLEREGGFATYDTQVGRVLDLSRDFEVVLATLAGAAAVKKYREAVARAEQGYEHQLEQATKAGATAKPYSAKATYAVGDIVEHSTFGTGVVRAIAKSRATIQFEQGTKVLVCA